MGGAKAGIIQNGKNAKVSTPMEPVSIESLVKTLAAMAVVPAGVPMFSV